MADGEKLGSRTPPPPPQGMAQRVWSNVWVPGAEGSLRSNCGSFFLSFFPFLSFSFACEGIAGCFFVLSRGCLVLGEWGLRIGKIGFGVARRGEASLDSLWYMYMMGIRLGTGRVGIGRGFLGSTVSEYSK